MAGWPLTMGETLQLGGLAIAVLTLRRSQRASAKASEDSIKGELSTLSTAQTETAGALNALTEQVKAQNGRVFRLEGAVNGQGDARGLRERVAALEAGGCG